ncbi:MAG TPA: hydrogenase maturation protease [Anaerolineales bacterium]|nr:hydrogenase maturation protease [Anaerolineales bacterium]
MCDACPAPDGQTLVLGLGNPLRGDDGIGGFVLGFLRGLGNLPDSVRLCPAEDGDVLGPLMAEPWTRIIVIDAADLGQPPGTWMRLGPTALAVARLHGSSHRMGLVEALGMAEALGRNPDRLAIFAVQPESTEWRTGLSEAVVLALPGLVNAVLWELNAPVRAGGRTIGTMPHEQATRVPDEQRA